MAGRRRRRWRYGLTCAVDRRRMGCHGRLMLRTPSYRSGSFGFIAVKAGKVCSQPNDKADRAARGQEERRRYGSAPHAFRLCALLDLRARAVSDFGVARLLRELAYESRRPRNETSRARFPAGPPTSTRAAPPAPGVDRRDLPLLLRAPRRRAQEQSEMGAERCLLRRQRRNRRGTQVDLGRCIRMAEPPATSGPAPILGAAPPPRSRRCAEGRVVGSPAPRAPPRGRRGSGQVSPPGRGTRCLLRAGPRRRRPDFHLTSVTGYVRRAASALGVSPVSAREIRGTAVEIRRSPAARRRRVTRRNASSVEAEPPHDVAGQSRPAMGDPVGLGTTRNHVRSQSDWSCSGGSASANVDSSGVRSIVSRCFASLPSGCAGARSTTSK